MNLFENEPLKCAGCGGEYLNHFQVDVFWRKEDASQGVRVSTDGGVLVSDGDISANPSPRRHGLTVRFDCEMCDTVSLLHIVQHKGNTYWSMDAVIGS